MCHSVPGMPVPFRSSLTPPDVSTGAPPSGEKAHSSGALSPRLLQSTYSWGCQSAGRGTISFTDFLGKPGASEARLHAMVKLNQM